MLVSLKGNTFRKCLVNAGHKLQSEKYKNFCCSYRVCYEIENYVGRAFVNSKLCKKLVALFIAYRT